MAKRRRKLYWKEALRQAQADLASPQAVVWLGVETKEAIRQAQPEVPAPRPARKPEGPDRSMPTTPVLVLVIGLLIPMALSYRRAYRQITHAISNIP